MPLQSLSLSDSFTDKVKDELINYLEQKSLSSHFLLSFSDLFESFNADKKMKAFNRMIEHIHMHEFYEVISSPSHHTLNQLFGREQFSFSTQSQGKFYGWFFEFDNHGFALIHSDSFSHTQRFMIDDCLAYEESFEQALIFEKAFLQEVAHTTIQFCEQYPENNEMLTHYTNVAKASPYINKAGQIKF